MLLLYLCFNSLNFLFFCLKFFNQLVKFLLQNFILTGCVQVIDLHTRNFIWVALNFDFFLWNILICVLGLLQQVCRTLLNSLLLACMINNVIPDYFNFCVKLHNCFLQDVLLVFHICFLRFHPLTLRFSLSKWSLKHGKLFSQKFLFSLNLLLFGILAL